MTARGALPRAGPGPAAIPLAATCAAMLSAALPGASPAAAPRPLPQPHGDVRVEAATSDTPRVITHTLQYCDQLASRATQLRHDLPAPLAEAELLAAEGERLCAQGQIRPGIMRLRRAIMLLRARAHPAPSGE